MVTNNHYRWDFIGLSTDQKPTPATSEKVVDGSTFYCADNSKIYVYCTNNWYERKALGDGGISDFDQLSNRPKYKNSEMTGDTNIKEFTGTDGNTAGVEGLVPAPATTDAGKFLKADGTWDIAGSGGGGVKFLTASDYNYPIGNPTAVNPGFMDPGIYFVKDDTVNIYNGVNSMNYRSNYVFIVTSVVNLSTRHEMLVIDYSASASGATYKLAWYQVRLDNGTTTLTGKVPDTTYIADDLTTNDASKILSAKQGKVLKDLIDGLDARITALEG